MMFFGRLPALLTVFALGTSSFANAAVSENCTLETDAFADNDAIFQATDEVVDQVVNKAIGCLEEDDAACDATVDLSNLISVCESEGGKFYQPELTLSCDVSGETTTLVVERYGECVGTSCSDADLTEGVELILADVTDVINDVTTPLGITCTGSTDDSGAITKNAVMIMIGSLVVATLSFI